MYNSFIIIICVFAVYGAYSIIRELGVLLSRKKTVLAAINAEDDDIEEKISLAEFYVSKYCFLRGRPVIISNDANIENFKRYGLDVYVRISGKERYVDRE